MLHRGLLAVVLGVLAMLVAVTPAHAAGEFFLVTGTADGTGPCSPYPNVPGGWSCPTLRSAVAAATADQGFDEVILQKTGTYQLTRGAIGITDDTVIAGPDAHLTTIQSDGSDRVFTIAQGADAILFGITVSGGNAGSGDGGGILNDGTLELEFARVTDSQANSGAGIASSGLLIVVSSLIDNNTANNTGTGGGILVGDDGSLLLENSTVYNNHAGSAGGLDYQSTQEATLINATVAANNSGGNPGGARFAGQWLSHGSLFARNQGDTPTNCEGPLDPDSDGNLEDQDSCGFSPAGTDVANIGLADDLSYQGGQTPVLTIPPAPGSPAKGFDTTCQTDIDQREAPRAENGACDAGAYEEGAVAPPVTSEFTFPSPPAATPTPTPTATATAPPTPTATPTPSPTPVPGKSVVVAPVKGKVLVRKPGTNKFVAVDATEGIPLGSTVDTTHGTIQLTSQQTKNGQPQTAIFFDGQFKITQTKTTTDLTLNQPLAPCGRRARASATAAKKKPKTRALWGSGHGSFRTVGQYSAATVRGTKWFVQDSCAGTLTRVAQGVVAVRDNVRHKTITLRAGKKYLARPRR